jgi:hypothetical protein
MYKVTVYNNEDGTIVDEQTFSNFGPAFMYKGCALRIGYERVEMEEV